MIGLSARTDANGKDPDSYSPTLKKYHQALWSKPLPAGGELILNDQLENQSAAGYFRFSSDSIIHTFSSWPSYQQIIQQIPKADIDHFMTQSYSIGGMLIFPADKIENKPTINGARGMHPLIRDRIDLTLECIRLYYENKPNPLYNCFDRYKAFFDLFGNFSDYIRFFLLQDLVNDDCSQILFFHPFEQFGKDVLPGNAKEYSRYMNNCLDFISKRNRRILEWTEQN